MKDYQKLKSKYEKTVNQITKLFENKQGAYLEFWVADEIGGVGCFGDNYFSITDIILDMDSGSKPGDIFDWQNDNTEENMRGGKRSICYKAYLKGLRIDQLPKRRKK